MNTHKIYKHKDTTITYIVHKYIYTCTHKEEYAHKTERETGIPYTFILQKLSASEKQRREEKKKQKRMLFTHEVRLYFSHIKMYTAVKIYAHYTIVHSVKCTLSYTPLGNILLLTYDRKYITRAVLCCAVLFTICLISVY